MSYASAQKVYASIKSYNKGGRLLSKNILQTLAESRDFDELVTKIKNTKDASAVLKITKPYTAEKIDSTLRNHLVDMHFLIVKTVGNLILIKKRYN